MINATKFNPEIFTTIQTPEVAYILGLLWADGYIYTNPKRSCNRVCIESLESDLSTLLPIFMQTGCWRSYGRNRDNRKPQMCIHISNKIFCHFLIENNYKSKLESACKIISKIPNNLKHYWFRGLVDGDGSFYYNSNTTAKQFNCSSASFQDWSYFELLFNEINIQKYTIRKSVILTNSSTSGKPSSYSDVRITNRQDIIKFGEYIYQNYENDKIGLERKYNKYLEIKNSPNVYLERRLKLS